jgi:diacylglycerol kinase
MWRASHFIKIILLIVSLLLLVEILDSTINNRIDIILKVYDQVVIPPK